MVKLGGFITLSVLLPNVFIVGKEVVKRININ